MNIIKDEKSDKSLGIEYSINQIKSVISYNNNSLVCYTVKKGRKDEPSCYFNILFSKFRFINIKWLIIIKQMNLKL